MAVARAAGRLPTVDRDLGLAAQTSTVESGANVDNRRIKLIDLLLILENI